MKVTIIEPNLVLMELVFNVTNMSIVSVVGLLVRNIIVKKVFVLKMKISCLQAEN